jgi:aminopeptidase N
MNLSKIPNFGVVIGIWSTITLLTHFGSRQSGVSQGPFSPSVAPAKYEREREYDLKHVDIHLKVDLPHQSIYATTVQVLAPLRDKLTSIHMDASSRLKIGACRVNTIPVKFTHTSNVLEIKLPIAEALGRDLSVRIDYTTNPAEKGSSPGWKWIMPDRFDRARKPAFWTYGWPEQTHYWVPIYDYPNDRTTLDEYIEVPKSWYVMGNGSLEGVKTSATSKTYHWKCANPISPYLFSLAGGEIDVAQETSGGVKYIYSVPAGMRKLIPASFGHTPDMVVYFSALLGVKYPWPKYGPSALFDFGGGMENASATSLGENDLVDERDAPNGMDGLVAHELAHQWFGDMITYKDWSQVWLSESFATYFQQLYTEHSQGKDAFDRDREQALQTYLSESRRYKRPLVTRNYRSANSMLDSHSYPKGALILHMLRREIGDADFFRGLGYYLKKHAYQVVETHDLIRAIAEATGRNVEPFFDQWVFKPGHPILSYSWKWDNARLKLILDVSQTQPTDNGAPLYRFKLPIGILLEGNIVRQTIEISQAIQQFSLDLRAQPDAVLLDPDHDLLFERGDKGWVAGKFSSVLRYAPSSIDRQAAALTLLQDEAGQESFWSSEKEIVLHESSAPLIVAVLNRLAGLKKAEYRSYFRSFLKHKDSREQAAAIAAVGALEKNDEDTALFRAIVNEKQPYSIVKAGIRALGRWDADGNVPTFQRALGIDSHREVIRLAALSSLSNAKTEATVPLAIQCCKPGKPRAVRRAAVDVIKRFSEWSNLAKEALQTLTKDEDPQIRDAAGFALK